MPIHAAPPPGWPGTVMKYLDEYRDEALAKKIVDEIQRIVTRPWVLMEVCGGQTHTIVKYGIDHLLPKGIELVHGPGCPVCVTSLEMIDKAHAIARRPDVIFCSFGDMLRVPGSEVDLLVLKSRGADVRVVYSPMDCLKIAKANPDKKVVFFAIGFETTAPGNAMAVFQAHRQGITNFSVLVSHVLVPPAMEAILSSPMNRVQGFLGPGHVCTVVGYEEYEPLAATYSRADRRHRLRADRPARRHPDDAAPARGRHGHRGKPISRASSSAKATAPRRNSCTKSSKSATASGAASGMIPQSGYRLRDEFLRARCRAHLSSFRNRYAGTRHLHQRTRPAGREEAARLPCLRHAVHAATSARRDDGLGRGRVRRLLRLRPASRDAKKLATRMSEREKPNIETGDLLLGSCPLPLTRYPEIVLAHGSGGKLSQQLIQDMILPEFRNPLLETPARRRDLFRRRRAARLQHRFLCG